MPQLTHQIDKNILYLTFNEVETRNAFSPDLAESLHQLRTSNKHSALVLRAKGPFFCSGGNLRHYQSLENKDQGLKKNRRILEVLDALENSPVPTVALVDGVCLGGGIELLSCFDQVIATPLSLFGLWQRRIGLTFGWGGEQRLVRRLGPARTRSWLNSSATISCWQAHQWGLVDQIELQGQLETAGDQWVSAVLEGGSESFREIKLSSNDDNQVFSKLWLSGRHKEVLSQF